MLRILKEQCFLDTRLPEGALVREARGDDLEDLGQHLIRLIEKKRVQAIVHDGVVRVVPVREVQWVPDLETNPPTRCGGVSP